MVDFVHHQVKNARWGLYLGEGQGGFIWGDPEKAVLVLGPPRSGKTTGIIIPNILAAMGPVISTSTKPDVMHATLPTRSQLGTCWMFDPSGSVDVPKGVTKMCWSPLSGCKQWDSTIMMVHSMVAASHSYGASVSKSLEASHWSERGEALLAPLLHAAALDNQPMRTVLKWVHRKEADEALALLGRYNAELAEDVLVGICATEERERSGIWSTAAGVLGAYRSEAVLQSTECPGSTAGPGSIAGFDSTQFSPSSDTVYILAAGSYQELFGPLIVGFIEQVRQSVYSSHAKLNQDIGLSRHLTEPPLLLALDEVANIAPISGLPAIVSEGGGQGLLTLACIQDLSQARTRWQSAADGFLTLFGIKLLLGGIADLSTLQLVSALCGDMEAETHSHTTGGWWHIPRRSTTTVATRRQRRLPIETLSGSPNGTAFLVDANSTRGWVKIPPYFTHPVWSKLANYRKP